MSRRKKNRLVIGILVAHFILGILYSNVIPLWESYDEWGHYPYIEYIATERALPHRPLTDRNDETHQPPLYYILGALATFWIDTSDDPEIIKNEFSVHRGGKGGINFHLHLENEDFPYQGTVLAAHLVRLVSVILSTIAVWATYLTARTLFPKDPYLTIGAMAVTAFWPQMLFIGSVITNDIMITACGSLVLVFMTKALSQGPHLLNLLGLGLSLGAGLLSKRNGLALVPFVLAGLIVTAIRARSIKNTSFTLLKSGGLVLISLALVSLWWLEGLRERYLGHVLHILSILSHPIQVIRLHWGRLPSGLYFCLATFFAAFGHLPLGVEAWIYKLVAAICLIAFLGLLSFLTNKLASQVTRLGIIILLFHMLAFLAAPAYRTLTAGGGGARPTVISSIQNSPPLLFEKNVFLFQGRFVLPGISSFSILLVVGLRSLVPEKFSGKIIVCLGLILFSFAMIAPFRYIRPAYARPRLLSPSEVQKLEHSVNIKFGDKIELLGYEIGDQDIFPSNRAPVTIYWRCLDDMKQNYPLKIEIHGLKAQTYGVLRLHPGDGNFPTSLWKKGDIFRETYRIPISPDVPTPSRAYIKASFQDTNLSPKKLKPYDTEGNPSNGIFGSVVIRSHTQPKIENSTYYELGDQIALVGYKIVPASEGLKVTLYWRALAAISKNYTVFVHVLDREGHLVAQQDRQPKEGLAPTSIWQEGVVVEDEYHLSIPSGSAGEQHRVQVGMYNLDTMERLPAFDAGGARLPHAMIRLAEIEYPLKR